MSSGQKRGRGKRHATPWVGVVFQSPRGLVFAGTTSNCSRRCSSRAFLHSLTLTSLASTHPPHRHKLTHAPLPTFQEIAGLLHSWKTELDESERIFVHAPGIVNRNSIFIKGVLSRGDARVRSVPFNTRRPTGKEVARVHHQLLALHPLQHLPPKKSVSLPPDAHSDPERGTGGKGDAAAEGDALREVEGGRSEDAIFGCVSKANMPGIKLLVAEGADVNVAEGKQGRTPLHRAAAAVRCACVTLSVSQLREGQSMGVRGEMRSGVAHAAAQSQHSRIAATPARLAALNDPQEH